MDFTDLYAKCRIIDQSLIEYIRLSSEGEATVFERRKLLIEESELLTKKIAEMQECLERLQGKSRNMIVSYLEIKWNVSSKKSRSITMELRLLKYFWTIAEEGTISQAAEVLHLTQPTLSRQLKELEEELRQNCLYAKTAKSS